MSGHVRGWDVLGLAGFTQEEVKWGNYLRALCFVEAVMLAALDT